MKRLFSLISTVIALLCIASCSTTKYVADGDYLLDDINVKCDDPEIDATDLYDYVIQQPNTPGTFFNKTSFIYLQVGKLLL